jgi:hypothetical protein
VIAFRECLVKYSSAPHKDVEASGNLWFLNPLVISQLISALIEVYSFYHDANSTTLLFMGLTSLEVSSCLQIELISIIGHIGCSNVNSVVSDFLPFKFGKRTVVVLRRLLISAGY